MSTVQMGICRASTATARSDLASTRAGRRNWSWLLRAMQRAAKRVLTWHERARQRRQLECLSDHMLRDIGLTRADVLAEATKRFWQS
ncbi:MAG TPA: DUF1127 domain-containing protein [Geminicoccaceae bacterium]|nr:DUF1127 domain-containing protein [Geminicoccaceae bacterium]